MPSIQRRTALGRLGAAVTAPWTLLTGRDSSRSSTNHVQWRQDFGGEDWDGEAVVPTPSGYLVLGNIWSGAGADSWLRRLDRSGSVTQKSRLFVDDRIEIRDATVSPEGVTVLGERDTDPWYRLVRLGLDGTVQWRRWLDTEADLWTLERGPKGLLLGGIAKRSNWGDGSTTAHVRAVTPDGTLRWKRTYDGEVVDRISARAGQVVLAGRTGDGSGDNDTWLRGIRPDGRPRWRHRYGSTADESVDALHVDETGVVYGVRTTARTTDRERAFLVRTTPDGKFVWRRAVELRRVDSIHTVGSDLVVVGRTPLSERTADPHRSILRLDRWGRVQSRIDLSEPLRWPFGTVATAERVVVAGETDTGVRIVATDLP